MHLAVAGLARRGVNVVNEHIFLERRWLRDALEAYAELPVLFVGVRCSHEELVRREEARERSVPSSGHSARQFHKLGDLHKANMYDMAFDTTEVSPEEAAAEIRRRLETARPAPLGRLRGSSLL